MGYIYNFHASPHLIIFFFVSIYIYIYIPPTHQHYHHLKQLLHTKFLQHIIEDLFSNQDKLWSQNFWEVKAHNFVKQVNNSYYANNYGEKGDEGEYHEYIPRYIYNERNFVTKYFVLSSFVLLIYCSCFSELRRHLKFQYQQLYSIQNAMNIH